MYPASIAATCTIRGLSFRETEVLLGVGLLELVSTAIQRDVLVVARVDA